MEDQEFELVKHETSPPSPLLVWTPLPHSNSHATYIKPSPAFSDIFYNEKKKSWHLKT